MNKVVSVVVTYNRLDLLKKCLNHLLNQTVDLKNILVIDNASTDGTEDYMRDQFGRSERVIYVRMKNNLGGAGGFSEGIRRAALMDTEYIWIMDDDTIPKVDALENLLVADGYLNGKWGFLSSNVRWINGNSAKMNQLTTQRYWSEHIDHNMIAVKTGTFVSLLVKKKDVLENGLPVSEFFIWGDDTEYTIRLSQNHTGYFVSESEVIHETKNNSNVNIVNENDSNRIGRYFYSFRNSYYIAKKEKRKLRFILRSIVTSFVVLKSKGNNKGKKFCIIYRGLFAGFSFNPKIKKV